MRGWPVTFVGGFENLVYKLRDEHGERILRLTHQSDRTRELVEAELDWIEDLANRGICVARPLVGRSGQLIESLHAQNGDLYHATAFTFAPGIRVEASDPELWNPTFFERWGEVLGRMHAASVEFKVPQGRPRRYAWNEDPMLNFEAYIPAGEGDVIEGCRGIVEAISGLSRSAETFGLIHADLHQGNFFVDQGGMTIFDFDDCLYHWFVCDLATVLYSVCWWNVEGDGPRQNAFAETFGKALLRGYRRHWEISPEWLEHIPLFLSLRDATIYAALHKRLDFTQLKAPQKRALDERRARLLGGGTPISIDFARL
ncbi:MAG: phosphotransferase [Bradymonadaceae bacterium]|nr:phosphotransferase [Lujinxingiaceae bacterium]